ncbi:MAG: hypothetical protein A3C30_04545 [Candidatus Levybacteria bacterium RIFCSPHIGHO2_02_FULL_40_18]|nr:MAG: hypothetical protein A2869_02200 [Candidatus Levybacteria bacterium RIFCSPHIGHO2_01_FULL_40_58]OGH26349.1 MAG: hypothetical protein A3C30_04545 [Candidatus Levybacteria bacterium RIFCSPHIGHO2_02_FULL_40_18]OGH31796.1 MAG: hypothetical protein A3E43_00340 [Candidatus Levybacteria bacterium RIFCSPHIGHO2_12_FULL_40_31]OGH40429.1 MAG: hypothetical protein A2894_00845 [Candidatus Levybacteria bacterium RIFCSPLOWO2_01_FULL_40_64]OGH49139.1 MAG: hypothetical protein A3I54_04240 [Candidatus Lev
MKHIAKAVALAVLALLAPHVVFADYITDAAQALKNAPVYVAPGTEGTDKDTAGKLQERLNKDDNIVLVMLPAAAESSLGADITTIASRLSEELGNRRIIGLAVGNNVVGYAPTLPAGVAADQMRRARSVSNDPVTTLGTFVQNMHIWQRENPQLNPPPLDSPEKGGLSWFVWLGIAVVIVLVVIAVLAVVASQETESSTEKTRFRAPDQVKELLAKIVRERWQIKDSELKDALYQLCVDIERYFSSSSKDKKRDSLFFRDRLNEVAQVLAKYADVQDNPRYYTNWGEELQRGKESITDFSEYVLESIRRGSAEDLFDFRVNTNILQAQRYR